MTAPAKLYEHPEHPEHWIGTDAEGGLALWPRAPKGWSQRVVYRGSTRPLRPADLALARATGWPGAPGKRRLAGNETGKPVSFKLDNTRREILEALAKQDGVNLSDIVRDGIDLVIASRRR